MHAQDSLLDNHIETEAFEHEISLSGLRVRFCTHSEKLYHWLSSYYEKSEDEQTGACDVPTQTENESHYTIHFEAVGSPYELTFPDRESDSSIFAKFCLVGDAECYLAHDKFFCRQAGAQEHHIVVDPLAQTVQANVGGTFLQSEETFIYVVLRDILRRLVLPLSGSLVLHGSVVTRDDQTIFFAGDKGMGKSTIALEMLKHGFQMVSDDSPIAVIDDKGRACVVSGGDQLSVTEQTLELFPELSHCLSRRRDVSGKYFLSRLKLGQSRISSAPHKITHFVQLQRGAFDACELKQTDRGIASAALMREFMPLFHKAVRLHSRPQFISNTNERMFGLLSQLLQGAQTFELCYANTHRSALPALLIDTFSR